RAVTEFPARPGGLAIVVEVNARLREQPSRGRHPADEVDHGAVTSCVRSTKRQAEHGAQMVLELAGDSALDRPVTGVVHAGRHLVGQQLAVTHEELDGEYPYVPKMLQHARQITGGLALERRRSEGRTRNAQNAARVDIPVQGVDDALSRAATRSDDGDLAVECNPFLVQGRHTAEGSPGALRIRCVPQQELPLTVVPHTTRLQHAGYTDLSHGAVQLRE